MRFQNTLAPSPPPTHSPPLQISTCPSFILLPSSDPFPLFLRAPMPTLHSTRPSSLSIPPVPPLFANTQAPSLPPSLFTSPPSSHSLPPSFAETHAPNPSDPSSLHPTYAPEAAVGSLVAKAVLVHGALRGLLLLLVSKGAPFHLAVSSPPGGCC